MSVELFPRWFVTPNTPDLGCFERNDHGFHVDSTLGFYYEYPPWEFVGGQPAFIPHQVYFRVKCGHAAFHQRVRVWMAPYGSNPIQLLSTTPDAGLGGDHRPSPSDWIKFPVRSGATDYWFVGEYRNPSGGSWQRHASVGHSYDIYDYGTLSTVGWDDTGGDLDHDDLVMEVAVVFRRSYFDWLQPVVIEAAAAEQLEREELPSFRSSDRLHPDLRPSATKS